MPGLDHIRAALWLVAATLAATGVFALWPGLDLAVSALFYTPGAGFPMSGDPLVEGLRNFIWDLSIGAVLLSAVALILAAIRRPVPGFGARKAGFVFLLYLLGPILAVNAGLKQHWGRARPADISEFGGAASFTPPWLPADQCVSNCSFVSGEGSAATALALTFLVLAPVVRRQVPGWAFRLYAAAGVILPAIGIALRVTTGRHFLSDTVFAMLLVLALALVLHRLILATGRG
ncbi:phosphatase PAP2 family protein [Defluviimonas sp. WL0024]|uniref:Phosphatase PAP2 family protein n=2 Tax=Albidovulum TaxID=205889 RepID=A0ABT3J9Y3_9RHOB|nr:MULTISPECIES: phosphatase PAP2 family protein [Defluviimonas]MCU9850455.1 phosphatase PAP2 family protein [Defluviimonas sp. WL0024]MCW3784485.1 phosphatase PAP2 family protein [Defluviimonas salinarum]